MLSNIATRRLLCFGLTVAVSGWLALSPRMGHAQADPEQDSEVGKHALGGKLKRSAEPADSALGRELRVAIAGSAPFVVDSDGEVSGFSVDVWREVANLADVEFKAERFAEVEQALDRVAAGDADVAVGPISITAARAKRVRFTQPYFQSSLAIASRPEHGMLMDRFAPFASKAFLVGAGTLLLVLVGVGTLFWVTERKRNPDMFPARPSKGIGNGIWMALVTMTTVGYGDRVPVTLAGRIIAGVWMLIAMITASSLTAGIATALTLSQLDRSAIQNADELAGREVAVVSGTVAQKFVATHRARRVAVADVDDALSKLEAKQVDAVVHDRPILAYRLDERPETQVMLSEATYRPQGYGFAVRIDDPELEHALNIALLKAAETNEVDELAVDWLGSAP